MSESKSDRPARRRWRPRQHGYTLHYDEDRIERINEWLDGEADKPPRVPADIERKRGKLYAGDRQIVPDDEIDQTIMRYYKDPKTTGGRDRLFAHLYDHVTGISRRDVLRYLKNSKVHQLHQPLPTRARATEPEPARERPKRERHAPSPGLQSAVKHLKPSEREEARKRA
ncbi:MAG: hypothetical protein KGL39_43860 [Patescibacteria group bacterium]|nr:hypothetical protein [Patescibacteria group bacterium]